MVKKEFYRRSSLQKLVVKLGMPEEEVSYMKNLFFLGQFMDRKPKNNHEIEKLKRVLAHLPFDDLESGSDNDSNFDFLKDNDYIRNNINFIPKLCVIFTSGNLDQSLNMNSKNIYLFHYLFYLNFMQME